MGCGKGDHGYCVTFVEIPPGIYGPLQAIFAALRDDRSAHRADPDRPTGLKTVITGLLLAWSLREGNLLGGLGLETETILNPGGALVPIMDLLGDSLIFKAVYDIHVVSL